MVKGTTRQVILVKSPDPRLFDEAIFLVREEAFHRDGVTADQVVRQARAAAGSYLRGEGQRENHPGRYSGPVWAVGAALVTSAVWAAWLLLV